MNGPKSQPLAKQNALTECALVCAPLRASRYRVTGALPLLRQMAGVQASLLRTRQPWGLGLSG